MTSDLSPPQTSRPDPIVWVLLLGLGAIWGSSFLGTKIALTGFSPIYVAASRITVAAITILVASIIFRQSLPSALTPVGRRIWLHALGFAVFTNVVPFSLLSWAQLHVTSAFAGITMALVPLAVLPLSHFLVPGERLGLRKMIGFVIGFAGAVVLIGPQSIDLSAGGGTMFVARLACMLSTVSYAVGAIITRLAPPSPQIAFSASGLGLASIMILMIAFLLQGTPPVPDTKAIIGAVYLGLFPTGLASIILVFIVRKAGPSFLSLVNYQVPVWAVIFGLVVLKESLPASFFGALALILTGLVISQLHQFRKVR